ncbi:carbohydrate-binding protein [Kineosporia succinea]|uniref:Uncharacterized protein n=1 Tax=Kineosporia succinea TaxID=84632 RepID=A0ABT9P896_9ACTN|nr:hypothetical protein [Kineosporia succinea]MDP9828644.1 hypothetical protein [Kineosporia succinea]
MTSRTRQSFTPWWGIGLLSLTVGASSLAVPALVPVRSAVEPAVVAATPTSGPTPPTPAVTTPTAPTPEVTTPAASPSAAEATTSSPVPSTTTRKPEPRATFEPVTINPWAKQHESDGIAVIDCPTCASGRRVQYLGQGHYVIVRLKDVAVSGRRTMTVIYTCACEDSPRDLDIMVNSDPVRRFSLKGAGSWEYPDRFTAKIDLVRGDNVIRFFNQQDPAPDLDQILVR